MNHYLIPLVHLSLSTTTTSPHGVPSLCTLFLLTIATLLSASVIFNCSFVVIEEWPTLDQYPNRSFVNGSLETGFFQYKRFNNVTENTIDKLFENPRKKPWIPNVEDPIPSNAACLGYYEVQGGDYPDPMEVNTLQSVAGYCAFIAVGLSSTALLFYLPILCFPRDRLSLDCFCFLMALTFVFQFLTLLVYGMDNCTEINGISTTCRFSLGTWESMIAMSLWFVLVITTYYMPVPPAPVVRLPDPVYYDYVPDQNYPKTYYAPQPEPEPEPEYESSTSSATPKSEVSEITLQSMKYVGNDKMYKEHKEYDVDI